MPILLQPKPFSSLPSPVQDVLRHQFWSALWALPWVQSIWLFGSRARGQHSPRADIDIALDCSGASPEQWDAVLRIVKEADTLLKIDAVQARHPAHKRPSAASYRTRRHSSLWTSHPPLLTSP